MQKPLDGFLVVSLEQAVAAPMCSCRLADAGARVIKIERPEGDFARSYDNLVHGESAYFIWLNRGKESAVLDLNSKADKAVLESILGKADVFIQNLKPGALKKLGFCIERLHQDYPSLILCSISGYGESGPYAGRKAYDLLIQADSGLASITGGPEGAARVGVSVVDIATGLGAYEAILEALFLRGRTGKGSVLSVSMFAAMADWMTVPLLQSEGGKPPRRMGLAHPSIAPYGVFKTKDGIDILISIQNDREWRLLAEKVLANPGLAQDTHFARNVDRVARRAETDGLVADAFGARMAEEVTAALAAADVAFAPVTDMGGLAKHPHLERIAVSTPTGPATYPRPPAHWDGTQRNYGAVPALGQHTDAIRAEFLSTLSRKIGATA